MSDYFCSDCKCFTEVVSDHSTGDTICSECGLVLESYSVDETSEWRSFADDSSGSDPNRVGNPVNPLLTGLSTVISRQGGGLGVNGHVPNRALAGRGGSDPDKNILVGFKTIAAMADRLSLVSTIKDRANEIFKRLDDQKCIKGRNMNALIAACIYIACRKEGKARTVKEICCAAHGASKKDVGRAKEFIVRQLKVEMGESMEMGTIHAGDYLRRFCSNLGMSNMEIKAVQETVQSSQECCDIRRSPLSVAAAIIYMILQLSDTKKTLRDIALSTTVADVTIRNAYKDIYPHASRIVPKWYASDIDLKKLAAVRN